MTPKKKANELVKRRYFDDLITQTNMYNAKRCARICVDEIIKSNPENVSFWLDVKIEIDKIKS